MSERGSHGASCGGCALSRRAFLRDATLAAGAALVALGAAPGALAALVREATPAAAAGSERLYDLPVEDGASIDAANEVILLRWQGRAHAFSLKCTHRGARLRWRADQGDVFCPRHKARFTAQGIHSGGRRTRDLDRYAIRREAGRVAVDLGALYRADLDPEGWRSAEVALG